VKVSHEPNTSDLAASKACTQSGAFALLLAAFLIVLIPYWSDRPRQIALAHYVTYRENLAEKINSLDTDDGWQRFIATHNRDSVESSMSLSALSKVLVAAQSGVVTQPVHPTESVQPQPSVQPNRAGVPNPPTSLQASYAESIGTIYSIVDLLDKLNDPKTLTDSMRESNYFTFSIMKWGNKRNVLMAHNRYEHSCSDEPFVVPTLAPGAAMPDYYAPLLNRETMLDCLTLADTRELSAFEMPSFPNPFQGDGRIKRELDIRPGALPADLFTASLCVQFLLAFTLLYFSVFAREAVLSDNFPANGTIFGAFSRSRGTLLSILLALFAPLAASIVMSVMSRRVWLALVNVPILGAALFAYRVLQTKSYFSALYQARI
jgi:hypothetical protein